MRQTTVRSRCECQSQLVATLNEQRQVLSGLSIDAQGNRDLAPAHSIGSQKANFDVGWLCNVCGRNVLRSFSADALVWHDLPDTPPPA